VNGLQAARKLRSLPVNIPVILFTMYSDALQFRDVEDAGVDAVVAKTNLVGLKKNIENLLNEAGSVAEISWTQMTARPNVRWRESDECRDWPCRDNLPRRSCLPKLAFPDHSKPKLP